VSDIPSLLRKFSFRDINLIQQKMLEVVPKSKNVMLLAPTGSGKTLAFLLPLLPLLEKKTGDIQLLILSPTRELAIQIEEVVKKLVTNKKVTCCYGGHAVDIELNNLKEPPAVLVGTPGRICHHLRDKAIDLSATNAVVVDEFDKCLELGFQPDLEFIFSHLPALDFRILTSATNGEIPVFTGMKDPEILDFLAEKENIKLTQKIVRSKENDKLDVLIRLICLLGNKPVLVFCNHRDATERISELLKNNDIAHAVFHGKLEQKDREKAIIKFRNGTSSVLITTDLASRGLDIPEIFGVVHYQLPPDESSFIHRNGRTARMLASGMSYVLLREGDELLEYLNKEAEEEQLPEEIPLPFDTAWETIYFSCGKKDKVNKIDLAGVLMKKGGLEKEEVGRIDVLDYISYVAVKRTKARKVVEMLKNEKVKNTKPKIQIAW
jgi:ATP-independent RNA helicase DbpA